MDSRRMTGSNLYTREPGAIVDVAFEEGDDPDAIIAGWRRSIRSVWPGDMHVRKYAGGVALFVSGPLDALMPLTDLNEWALDAKRPLDPKILAEIASAHVPGLAETIKRAREHDVPLLVDDDAITVGAGAKQVRFDRKGPVDPQLEWSAITRVPIGIVTGTNGKTTTTRLVARMAKAAGRVPGITSSDGVAIDEVIEHRGDFSGPEGTRLVLRDTRVEIAILETARGGILRRGLTVERCDAAVITNVSGDHLGDYGVDDVATMARVKGVVGRDAKTLILNADDPSLVAIAPQFKRVVWFSRTQPAEWCVRDGSIVHGDTALIAISEIPITFGGRAAYNIENALAASALAHALGIPDAAIVEGLRTFSSTSEHNPGRGNLYEKNGVSILLDFGHNPVAIRSVMAFARSLVDGGALRVTIGMPGDRRDQELREIAATIADGKPAQVIVRELPHDLLRGRELGVIPEVIASALRDHVPDVGIARNEVEAVTRLLDAARPGDLVLVLTHLDRAVEALLVTSPGIEDLAPR